MSAKDILENCKSEFPLEDEWIKKQCKKAFFNDKKRALVTYCYLRETIKTMNELHLYNLIPDDTKKDIIKVITNTIITSELLKKAWSTK